MKYTIDRQDRYSIISLQEENLNSVIAPDLKSQFIIMKNEGTKSLIFDIQHVKFVDSSGLSAILTGNRLWKDEGSFVITGVVSESIRNLIEISRLETVLNILPTVQESIDFVIMEELERDLNEN